MNRRPRWTAQTWHAVRLSGWPRKARGEGLDEKVVEACSECFGFVLGGAEAGQRDQQDAVARGCLSHASGNLVSVKGREADVDQGQLAWALKDRSDTGWTIFCNIDETVASLCMTACHHGLDGLDVA